MKKYQATFLSKSLNYQSKDSEGGDVFLWALTCIFRDCFDVTELIYKLSYLKGYGGNHAFIRIDHNIATVTSLYFGDEDEIEIPTDKFMKFLYAWQEATKDNPNEITLYRDDDYNIWIEICNESM